MLETYLEPIYKKALLISDFEESIKLLQQYQYTLAQQKYNAAISQVESFLPELSGENASLAERILTSALRIAKLWNDGSSASGEIASHLVPLMYEYMSYFTGIDVVDGNYQLKSTDSGFLTLIDTSHNITFHDIHNPMTQASVLADSIYSPANSEIHILGCDLGYLPYMLYVKSFGALKIVIYEDDTRVINYAWQFGVLSWIPEDCLNIISNDDPIMLAKKFLDFLNKNETRVDNGSISMHINHWKTIYYKSLGTDIIENQSQLFAFEREKFQLCVINMMKNYSRSHITFDLIKEKYIQKEWVIVAAGPSLDYCTNFINDSKGKKGIIAVNTVIKRLAKEMITPDIIVAADSRKQLLDHLSGYEQFTKNISLIADETTFWQYIANYLGDICLVPTPNGKGLPLSNPDGAELWEIYGTVSSLALETA
ncbi:MAG: DUF115 domain-containing protein, partial [Lachnospiraceae bacterium]|nr:DUF115 domain-containing protein [Lachnospiraceae bacterium]